MKIAYFHRLANIRQLLNRIHSLVDDSSEIVTGAKLANHILLDFKKLFGQTVDRRISLTQDAFEAHQQLSILEEEFTVGEV